MSDTGQEHDGLNERQRLFCLEYLKDYNGTLAAIRAGYSKDTARIIASQLLAKLNIKAEVEKGQAEIAERVKVSVERLDEELRAIALFDPGDLFDEDGRQIPIQDLDPTIRAAISGFEFIDYYEEKLQQGVLKKWKTHDKQRAIELLFKRRGAITEKFEIDDVSGLTDEERAERTLALLNKARERRMAALNSGSQE